MYASEHFWTIIISGLTWTNEWIVDQSVYVPSTLLLLSIVHADFKDGRPFIAQQSGSASGGVQLENAATTVLVPEQEVFIVAQTKGVVQFLSFIYRLVMWEKQQDGMQICFKHSVRDYSSYWR